jgi:hypothetical protein
MAESCTIKFIITPCTDVGEEDGKIERWEWIKSCPCFEVKDEFNW